MWIKPEYDYYDFGKINLKMPITAAGAIAGVAAGRRRTRSARECLGAEDRRYRLGCRPSSEILTQQLRPLHHRSGAGGRRRRHAARPGTRFTRSLISEGHEISEVRFTLRTDSVAYPLLWNIERTRVCLRQTVDVAGLRLLIRKRTFALADRSSIVGSYVRMVYQSRGRVERSCGERDAANCRYRGVLL